MKLMFYTTAHTLHLSVKHSIFAQTDLVQPQSTEKFIEVCTNDCWIAEQHQSQSAIFTFSVSFFHSDMLYLQGRGES